MKKRNIKILIASIALSLNVSLLAGPFTTSAYADISKDKNLDIKLEGTNNISSVSNNFTITNKGENLELSKVKIRYYLTADKGCDNESFSCYYSAISALNKYKFITNSVHGNFVKLDAPTENADSYLEISFDEDAGALNSSETLTLYTSMHNNDWSPINSDDDYSFNDASKISVLVDDKTVSDTTPKENYLSFSKDDVKDTEIAVKNSETPLESVTCYSIDSKTITLNPDTDYSLSDGTLTLKESFLKTLIGKNSYVYLNFGKDSRQTVFINNADIETVSDPLRSGINDDEPNVSFASHFSEEFASQYHLSLAVKNTGNNDMDLKKLNITYYYSDSGDQPIDKFNLDYCSVLGSNKDLRSLCDIQANSFGVMGDFMYQRHLDASFIKDPGVLKPGETLVLMWNHEGASSIEPIEEPVVTYDGESLYGETPDFYSRDSKILSDDIVLDKEKDSDLPVKLDLRGNALKSIDEYSDGKLVKTLKKGTDYKLTKRNEVILNKSYLDTVKDNVDLSFKFSKGSDDTLYINRHLNTYPDGTLNIKNRAAKAIGTRFVGYPYTTWEKLTVPIVLTNDCSDKISEASITLKFDNSLFDEVQVEPYISVDAVGYNSISSAHVDYDLGIIKITLKSRFAYKIGENADFGIIFTPKKTTDFQKVNLSLSSNSYYETENGERFKPVFSYNDIELVPR